MVGEAVEPWFKRREQEMKKRFFLTVLSISALVFVVAAQSRAQNQLSEEELFVSKCTKCHDAERAKKIHGTTSNFKETIKGMQSKEGANISDQEVDAIARLLADPNREIFETKCSKCHTLDRVDKVHLTGETSKKVLNTMCAKKGCDISPGEKAKIDAYLRHYAR